MSTISWLLATLVLIISLVTMFVNKLDYVTGVLIAVLAFAYLLSGYTQTTFVRRT